MPMPDYSIRSAPQLQQQQGPLGALGDFAKSKALSAGLEAAFPGSGLAKEAGEAVLPALLEKGGDVKKKQSWWQKVGERVWGDERAKRSKAFLSGEGSAFTDYKAGGGSVSTKPIYQRLGGMTPGPLGMSDMLAAGKGKDVSKVTYVKKGGDIEDKVEIAYHAPLAPKPAGE